MQADDSWRHMGSEDQIHKQQGVSSERVSAKPHFSKTNFLSIRFCQMFFFTHREIVLWKGAVFQEFCPAE